MLDFFTLIKPSYWFNLAPVSYGANSSNITEYIVLGFFVAILLAGIVLRIVQKRYSLDRFALKMFRALTRLLVTMGILGVILLFFSFEQVRLLGARFWYPLWLIGSLIWLFFILRTYFTVAPKERVKEDLRRQKEKYLPRSKK
ncbi:MAG: hypothetical protein V1664_05650 [Candidatus Uhrbacteria bacterium]